MTVLLKRMATLGLVAAALPAAALADEVFLKSGGRLSGRVVSRTDTTIEIDVGAGRIAVPVSSVERVEEGQSALQEYEERAGRLSAGDVDGWLALGEWASARGLGSQATEAYHRALSASPGDPRANAAVGNVQVGASWVSEDEGYRARGFVELEGEWMTPAERDAILRERAADDQRDRERRQAEVRAREADARAEEAEARAREAEAEASGGMPLWYAWGGGPVYWQSPSRVSRPIARPVPR
jgi:hypothetical protein